MKHGNLDHERVRLYASANWLPSGGGRWPPKNRQNRYFSRLGLSCWYYRLRALKFFVRILDGVSTKVFAGAREVIESVSELERAEVETLENREKN